MERLNDITEEEWNKCNKFNRDIMQDFLDNSTELSPQTLTAYHSNLMIWFNFKIGYLD